MCPREYLQILAEDDVSMLPNKHPWISKRVRVEQTGQVGEIVHVAPQGRVKIALDGPQKKKKTFCVDSAGSSFEALFTEVFSAEAPQQAAPPRPAEAEVRMGEARSAIAVADSDAESDGPSPRIDEPAAPKPEKKAAGEKRTQNKKAAKRKPAAAPRPPEPKRKRVGGKVSSTIVDGVDVD